MAVAVDSRLSRWLLRLFVLGAFALTVWLCGPRAATVLAMRLEQSALTSPVVVLDRLGVVQRPEWLSGNLLLTMVEDLGPWLGDELPILDEAAARRLRDGLATVPWVASAGLERVFPNSFRLRLQLRRPILAVLAADHAPLGLCAADGTLLPWVDLPLPRTVLPAEQSAVPSLGQAGQLVADPRVRAAVGVLVEWQREVAPLVPSCPVVLQVDANNLGERLRRGRRHAEVAVHLQRDDGAPVVFAYDRPVDSSLARIPAATKAAVLRQILAIHPGLAGLTAGDLRLVVRWADYLEPRPAGAADPDGPWSLLDSLSQRPR